MLQTMEGGCHCGRVRFRVTGDLTQTTYCNCSICTKKGILHLGVSPDEFELLSGADALVRSMLSEPRKARLCRSSARTLTVKATS